jgi:hypothetical protein
MKTKFVFASFLAALGSLAAFAPSAKAGTDFSVSVNIGAPPIIVTEGGRDHRHDRGYRGRDHRRDSRPHGYWKEVVVKTWIPGRWVTRCDRRGHEVRIFESGHFGYRTERVWVSTGRDHDRHDDRRYSRR